MTPAASRVAPTANRVTGFVWDVMRLLLFSIVIRRRMQGMSSCNNQGEAPCLSIPGCRTAPSIGEFLARVREVT